MHGLPLLSPEAVADLREYLKLDWFATQKAQYMYDLRKIWSPPSDLPLDRAMLDLSCIENPQRRGHEISYIDKWMEYQFYNKATVFYWTEPAFKTMDCFYGPVILGGIWYTWAEALGREPQVQLDEFFAVPVSVREVYAKTIPGIVRAHKQICTQVRKAVEENSRANTPIKLGDPWPDPRYFKLYPICEALITVYDEFNYVTIERQADGLRHCNDFVQHQTIILARTGDENGLSAPISFESLKDKALPLARSEDMGTIDVIRVPFQTGVRFVASILLREEAAFPESAVTGPCLSKEAEHPFMKWERQLLEHEENRLALAQQKNKIKPFTTVDAVKDAVLPQRIDKLPRESWDPIWFKLGWD